MSAHARADGLPRGRTHLPAALIAGQRDVVRPLIARGADPALADDEVLAAFLVPALTATQQPLLEAGVPPGSSSSQDGVTPARRRGAHRARPEHMEEVAASLIKDNVKKEREEVV